MVENVIAILDKFLEDNDISTQEFVWMDIDDSLLNETIFEGIEEVRNERLGSDFDQKYITFYLPKVDRYIEINGYYSSHNGTDFDGESFYEVTKVTKTVEITEYNQI